jgi:hypothetical protein
MCLRFVFLLTTQLSAWRRLSRRQQTWKTAEILILRHQRTVLQRRGHAARTSTNLGGPALLSVIPKARRHGLRLLVTPGTILRWHRDIARRWAARSIRGKTGRSTTRRSVGALVPGALHGRCFRHSHVQHGMAVARVPADLVRSAIARAEPCAALRTPVLGVPRTVVKPGIRTFPRGE